MNVDVFTAGAAGYHAYRIEPPAIVAAIAASLLGGGPLRRVVDLGCGTGLSTRVWAGRADEVVGVEPNAEMRTIAAAGVREAGLQAKVSIVDGRGDATGVADGWADVVACSQSLHWIEPRRTHPEIARILRPGGVLLAFGYTMPPTLHPRLEAVFNDVLAASQSLIRARALWPGIEVWQFPEHLSALREAGHYGYSREAFCHQELRGTAEWFCGLARNYGAVARALAKGVREEELGLPELDAVAKEALGAETRPALFHYKMIAAVK